MRIHFLTGDDSWIVPFVDRMVKQAKVAGHETQRIAHHDDLVPGDLLFILGYLRVLPDECLDLHDHNLVVHESDLPKGRGFSPMSWQIAEDRREIPFCLFEAVPEVDAGPVYSRRTLHLDGTELHHEWRELQGLLTERMVLDFIEQYPDVEATPQKGESTFYERRTHEHDEIDIDQPFRSAFHDIRVCNPKEYPAWFEYEGRKFKVSVEPWEEE
ncbi:methionyl-tRNA formyltransferase [Salinibacter ruber]|uniref:formyltransferase family protein n=1 Tax=Salinibacter ruber TaxID=146919 RepID=UPI00216993A3|nr:formyltransferase family protein [Salinibacter ruber]MCS3955392.1 methionyl-tRNA formyltransferase [Salinibacter ruber]